MKEECVVMSYVLQSVDKGGGLLQGGVVWHSVLCSVLQCVAVCCRKVQGVLSNLQMDIWVGSIYG